MTGVVCEDEAPWTAPAESWFRTLAWFDGETVLRSPTLGEPPSDGMALGSAVGVRLVPVSPVRPDPSVGAAPSVGVVPDPSNPPSGCYFHPRCPYAVDRCRTEPPVLRELAPNHVVSCHRAEELALRGVVSE